MTGPKCQLCPGTTIYQESKVDPMSGGLFVVYVCPHCGHRTARPE